MEDKISILYLFSLFADSGFAARTSEENKKREISFKQVPKSTFLRNLLSLVKNFFESYQLCIKPLELFLAMKSVIGHDFVHLFYE